MKSLVSMTNQQRAWFVDLLQKSDEIIDLEIEVARLNMQAGELRMFALNILKLYRNQVAQTNGAAGASPTTPPPDQ